MCSMKGVRSSLQHILVYFLCFYSDADPVRFTHRRTRCTINTNHQITDRDDPMRAKTLVHCGPSALLHTQLPAEFLLPFFVFIYIILVFSFFISFYLFVLF